MAEAYFVCTHRPKLLSRHWVSVVRGINTIIRFREKFHSSVYNDAQNWFKGSGVALRTIYQCTIRWNIFWKRVLIFIQYFNLFLEFFKAVSWKHTYYLNNEINVFTHIFFQIIFSANLEHIFNCKICCIFSIMSDTYYLVHKSVNIRFIWWQIWETFAFWLQAIFNPVKTYAHKNQK